MAPTSDELLRNTDIAKIAEEGSRIYEKIKSKYEPGNKGRFLAIEVDSEVAFLGNTSAEALISAKEAYPSKVFYVIKIGYDVAETMARNFVYA